MPCAYRRPDASSILASAVAVDRPTWTARPIARSVPESVRIWRTKFAFVSSVVYPTPSGSIVCTAQPVAESTSVNARPPWTTPSGLSTYSDA